MKKLMLLSLVLGMFIFSSCDSKRAYCDCVNSAMELMEKVQSGEMTEDDADAELANCKWMEDLSEDESAAELKKCTEGAAGDMAKGINKLQELSEDLGIPYQSLINLYLRDCASSQRKLNLRWK